MERLGINGVTVELDGSRLFEEGLELRPSIRMLGDLNGVLFDRKVAAKQDDRALYYMYRQVGCGRNPTFQKKGIRYDITIIPEYDIGRELNKTLGHYHSVAEKGLSYPEMYEVIKGEALYVFQKNVSNAYYDALIVSADAGDKVLVPPNYGHITVNRGRGTLVMANLVSDFFKPDYQSIIDKRGGVVYALTDGSTVLNDEYKSVRIRHVKGAESVSPAARNTDLHDQFLADPDKFEFLQKPHLLRGIAGLG